MHFGEKILAAIFTVMSFKIATTNIHLNSEKTTQIAISYNKIVNVNQGRQTFMNCIYSQYCNWCSVTQCRESVLSRSR